MASGRRYYEPSSDSRIATTIQKLANEQELVQKKTFTNWMNSILAKRNPPLQINELFEDIKDGTKLLALLETVSGEKLQLPFRLRGYGKQIKLVNINASDIVDGKPAIVLGLVWVIILYYQAS
ncbi:calmin-like [Ptychodera flava]|uniref:calmin-like n=1 Tax=Ptychodera flava TaxID=63121 RepID=UPI00396AAE3F